MLSRTLNRRALISGTAGATLAATLSTRSGWAQDAPADAAEVQELRLPAMALQVRLDPHFGYSVYQIGTFVYFMWSGLTKTDKDLGVVGDIATSWDVSEDGKTYTFHLDPERKFSDGTPITANDVVWSWTRSLNPATESLVAGGYLKDVVGAADYWQGKTTDLPTGYRAIDDHTFEVQLIESRNYFHEILVHPCTFVVKQSDVEAGTPDNPWQFSAKGFSGPYAMESYEEGQSLVLVPNANYPVKPIIQKLSYRLVDDAQTQFLLYQNDEVDFTPLAEPEADNIKNKDQTLLAELIEAPQWWENNLYLRNKLAPFDDEHVRKAFGHAINKDAIMQSVLKGLHAPINSFLYPGLDTFTADVPTLAYDPEAAKAELQQSSYGSADKLPPIGFIMTEDVRNTTIGRMAAALQEMWRQELGVEVETQIMPSFEDALTSDVQIVIGGEALHYPDSSNALGYLRCASGANWSQFCDEAWEARLDEAESTQDAAHSVQLYQELQHEALDHAVAYPIYQVVNYFLVKPRLKNLLTTAMYTFPNFEQVYIAKE